METKKINELIGKKIELLLRLNNISQSELARRVGYSTPTTINMICRGTRGPGKGMIVKIAKELGVPPTFLTDRQEYTPEEWTAIMTLQRVIAKKNRDPKTYKALMDAMKKAE